MDKEALTISFLLGSGLTLSASGVIGLTDAIFIMALLVIIIALYWATRGEVEEK